MGGSKRLDLQKPILRLVLKSKSGHKIFLFKFSVDEILLNHTNINLVFEGLDTFATIFVNDILIGSSENMFVRYIFDVKKNLKVL